MFLLPSFIAGDYPNYDNNDVEAYAYVDAKVQNYSDYAYIDCMEYRERYWWIRL